jgi:hypothetical protein
MMVIKKLNAATFDVFWNNGWEYWARFSRQTDGTLKFVSGKQMPTKLFQQFRSIVNKRGKGRQIQAARQELQVVENQQHLSAVVEAVRLNS